MTSVKSLQKQLLAAVAMVLVAAIAMSSATYAWFVNNAQVTATDVSVQAAGAYSLLISNDNETWGTTTKMDTNLAKLTPVSTVGEVATEAITLTKAEGTTVAVGIGDGNTVAVGDVRFVTNIGWEDNFITTVSEVSRTSKVGENTYFYSDTLYLKAAQQGDIYLDSTGIGIVWAAWDESEGATADAEFITLDKFMDLEAATTDDLDDDTLTAAKAYNEALDSAQALLKTLRIGLLVTQSKTADSTTTYTRTWHEYELVSAKISDDNATNTTKKNDSTANGIGYAVSAKTSATDSASVTETEPYIAAITGAKMAEGKTILSYAIEGQVTGLATATGDADKLAAAAANEVVQVDVYIWMEGCDYDTVAANINSFADAKITGFQLGFCLGGSSST
jgi:hypothetical protein